jgi:hypothetical protein
MKQFLKLVVLLSIVVSFGTVVLWYLENIPSSDEMRKQFVSFYNNEQYSGLVIDKYIDNENHLYETVVIRGNDGDSSFFFNADIAGIFEYLAVGDSVEKKSGELFISIQRGQTDTIIKYKFRSN